MNQLDVLSIENAPADSKSLFENSLKNFGVIPNLHGVMAAAPAMLEGYQKLHELFQKTSFDADELTVVWQTINVESGCHYCVPAHTMIAHSMKVDGQLISALSKNEAMPTPKLQALHDITLKVVRERGKVSSEDVETFYNAGYGPQQLLEIILGLAQKVMSNYTNHVAVTPVDSIFAKYAE